MTKFLKLLSQLKKNPAISVFKPPPPKVVKDSSSASYHIEGEDSADFRPKHVEEPDPRDEYGRPIPFDPSMLPDVRDEFGRKQVDMEMNLARRITNKIMKMNSVSSPTAD